MTCSRIGWVWAVPLLWLGAIPASNQAAPARVISYNHDILPILSDNCFSCHGPDQRKRKGKLRLDIREEALVRKAFVPGKADESELIRRIFTTDEDDLMPPPKSPKKLTEAQKELLQRWINAGAEYEKHWAYIPPTKPSAPANSSAIDFLIQERLKELGLKASPEADRRTLARRLYVDLVGLRPKPEAVEAFEHDTAPGAYDRLVAQLLASPEYGERMALGWLDVVRYADTIGYHSDNPRNVWPYRDYVIKAFNQNKRFDQFTREQLAGDLLPHSTLEQKVASAFNRLLLTTEEGGAQPKDYEARMLTDRVRAVGTVWLGQTIGCAQCHDHKFDPITSRDFYSMGAFFADVKEPAIGRREEGMVVPNARELAELARLGREVERWRKEYEAPRPGWQADWEVAAMKLAAAESNWTVLQPEAVVAESNVKLTADANGVISSEKAPKEGIDTYRITVRPRLSGIVGFRLEVLDGDNLHGHGPGRAENGGFVLTEFHAEDVLTNSIEFASATATYETPGFPAFAAVDGSTNADNGWAVRGMRGVAQAIYIKTGAPVDTQQDVPLTLVLKQSSGSNQVFGRFRLAVTTEPEAVSAPRIPVPPHDMAQLLRVPVADRTEEQSAKLSAYYRSVAPELAGLRQQLAAAQKARDDYEATVPHCLVSVAADEPTVVRILPRGNWMMETGEIVHPALPAYLVSNTNSLPNRRLTRLDLANWLVSRDNPLTARVFVNRLWKQFFGIGLSKVLDDFGAQGEAPSNQALLDWLACEFVESGWDIKHMVRLMVESHAYRQVSTASSELQSRDPYNRELARQSRWRLDAELVRDNALSISGLLVQRIGGPSVKPYQPEGYWENLNFPVRTYEPSQGPDQYRRGLYTWWQRSFVHPSLLAFDAPTREECAADRSRSNIPQQALVLLNDPTYVEAARSFALRILREGGSEMGARLSWAWQQVLDREPRPDEVRAIQSLLSKQVPQYEQSVSAAEEFLGIGQLPQRPDLDPAELAAWTNVARVLLNLHETITRS